MCILKIFESSTKQASFVIRSDWFSLISYRDMMAQSFWVLGDVYL
jgi:hypothetical protein